MPRPGVPGAAAAQGMKKAIPVQEAQFGMFIAELDRPWTETPFMFQGFVLQTEQQREALLQYCKKVYIDTEKGTSPVAAGQPGRNEPRVSVLASIKEKTAYQEKASVSAEVPAARAAHARTELVLKDVLNTVRAGKAVDAPRVKEAVNSMTNSVVRNPDAMLLLTRMREKNENTLDRALSVSIYMITFGRFLQLPREQLDMLGMLGLLQDVGKVRISDGLLQKREPLNEAERKVCCSHVRHSVEVLQQTHGLPPELPRLASLHHERCDGSGYPQGLRGDSIGLFGSIAGLVDCFDAMTHPRPYGEVLAPSNALNLLYEWRNKQFDGALVEQFIHCIGIFPVGAIVELHSGEIGIVIAQNPVMRLMPKVMVVMDKAGRRLKPQKIVERADVKRTLERDSVQLDTAEFFL